MESQKIAMRIPTNKEWEKLVEVTGGDNEKMHWIRMYSYVNDTENEYKLPAVSRALRGYYSARIWDDYSASYRYVHLGFRPAIENLDIETLPSEGDACVIGTLYMDGTPVRVPQNPTEDGDIADYIPGTKLEMRKALPDPDYQVTGIHLGNGVFVADRVLLKKISYKDIEQATRHTPQSKEEEDKDADAVAWDDLVTRVELALEAFRDDILDSTLGVTGHVFSIEADYSTQEDVGLVDITLTWSWDTIEKKDMQKVIDVHTMDTAEDVLSRVKAYLFDLIISVINLQ